MHLHNRLNIAQTKFFLSLYVDKKTSLSETLLNLGIKRRRLFQLLKLYKQDKLEALGNRKPSNKALPKDIDDIIKQELEAERKIIHNKDIPVNKYNYSFVTKEVIKSTGIKLSYETVRKKAHAWGFTVNRFKSEKPHTRIILTDMPGVLLQHDSSHHLFAPASGVKWYLISTIDDFSRKILCAKLVEEETTWEHIMAVKFVVSNFGIPQSYYADNRSIFRFTKRMDSFWRINRKSHKDVVTQWQACLKALDISVIHALSPQAKGKVERPYRWIQDHLVRLCVKYNISNINDAQKLLNEDIYAYNTKTVY